MVSKAQKVTQKISKCVKKKIDEKDVLMMRLTGKFTGAQIRELKAQINALTIDFLTKKE